MTTSTSSLLYAPASQLNTLDFQVSKSDLHLTRLLVLPDAPLKNGEVRLQIECFALTSNNITYAAFGDAMHYWNFYPASDGWGRIPVWGFASVFESRQAGVAVGDKFYGFYPMASRVTLTPTHITARGFQDGAAHRSALHPVYNQYIRTEGDPFYSPHTEALQVLLLPLFSTAFVIDDFLFDNDFFGACAGSRAGEGQAGVLLLSSASSKTAYSTAFFLAQRAGVEVVGLTSPANVAFCESLGCYSRVLSYNQLDTLASDVPCNYIDFAGNAALRQRIHSRFTKLKYSCAVGGTHVEQLTVKGCTQGLPGVRATLFFAPAQIKKRSADWGPTGLVSRLHTAWRAFTKQVMQLEAPWLVIQTHVGGPAVQSAYQTVLGGAGDPRAGHVLSL